MNYAVQRLDYEKQSAGSSYFVLYSGNDIKRAISTFEDTVSKYKSIATVKCLKEDNYDGIEDGIMWYGRDANIGYIDRKSVRIELVTYNI